MFQIEYHLNKDHSWVSDGFNTKDKAEEHILKLKEDGYSPRRNYIKIEVLKDWVIQNGYLLETHKNEKFEGIYNCYLKNSKMPKDRCIKAFLYRSELEAVVAACLWLKSNYKKVTALPEVKPISYQKNI